VFTFAETGVHVQRNTHLPGNEQSSRHSMPGLTRLLSNLSPENRPQFVRGDCDWGNDSVMTELEEVGEKYLFKVKKHKGVKELINKAHCEGSWTLFKDNWEIKESHLEFGKSNCSRRVVLVRRLIQKETTLAIEHGSKPRQLTIPNLELPADLKLFEYSVLITNLESDIISIAQHYRDRADSENLFDEMKNQWGWGGYTTKDIKTSKFMSRIIALIYNWWNLYVRLVTPDGYKEAITSRPLLMTGVGRLTESGRQRKMNITSQHGWGEKARKMLSNANRFLSSWKSIAPQLTEEICWQRIIDAIVAKFARSAGVGPPYLAQN